MEATATCRDGFPGSSSSSSSSSRRTYKRHEQMCSAGSDSRSSRSGTIVSTAYTSGASRTSLLSNFELKIHDYDEHLSPFEQEKMKRVIELVNGGVEGWFTELEVTWLLDLPDDEYVREIKQSGYSWAWIDARAPSWFCAFSIIVRTIRFTRILPLPDPSSHTGDDDEEEQALPNQFFLWRVTTKILQRLKNKLFLINDRASIPDQIQFARFIQMAMLKLVAFVDVLVAVDFGQEYSFSSGNRETYSYHKSLNLLLDVHRALTWALQVINVLFISRPPGEAQNILGDISSLLSTKEDKALNVILLTLNDTTIDVLKRIENLSLQQRSSDIHKVTWNVISHISYLLDNKSSLYLIESEAVSRGKPYLEYGSPIGNQTYSDSMTMRIMASRLHEGLASMSETFPDQGLRFLFLLNNSHRLHQCLRLQPAWPSFYWKNQPGWPSLQLYVESLSTKVDDYMQSYLQVSWAQVLSSLFNNTPGKTYSPLTRFESEFQETYITQKQWKVPDPEVRKNLRTAIIEQIIPGYTKYIEENNITTPKLSPQELEEMLQDLFEG